MVGSWQHSQAQQQAVAAREQVTHFSRVIAKLESDREIAAAAEGEHRERVERITGRMAEIRSTRYPIRTVDGYPSDAVPAEILGEYRWLEAELAAAESQRVRWIASTTIRGPDAAGVGRSYSLQASVVDGALGVVRTAHGVARAKLDEIEGRLSPGELVQTGVTAPDYAEHRQRVEALRQRIG